MSSKTDIVNHALIHLGISQTIANVDTEASREATSARLIWDQQVGYVLRDFPWPFARAFATLGLVSDPDEALNTDWYYSYRYPSDCVQVRRIMLNGRRDPTPAPYALGRDTTGRLIFTDIEDAEIEYTSRITNPEEFDDMFAEALSYKIAMALAPMMQRVTGNLPFLTQMYALEITKAQRTSLNEEGAEPALDAEWVRNR